MKTLIVKKQDEPQHRGMIEKFRSNGWSIVIR